MAVTALPTIVPAGIEPLASGEGIAVLAAAFWAGTVAWLILRAVRQFDAYQVLEPEPGGGGPASGLPSIAVIVPARDEADAIGRCLAGLKAQDYPADRLKVVVVDDGSTDGTAALARRAGAGDPRFTIIEAGPLPPGWTGKSHACWRGAAAADGDWLCFIDADTAPGPALLDTAITAAGRLGLDLLSLEPMQELLTPWERLVIPAGFFALAFARDLRRVNDPARAEAVANGQFILVRRPVYERIGGHAAVREAIAEDSMLAGRAKAAGCRFALLGGASLITTRMYRNLPALWEGLSKNVTETMGGVRATLLVSGLAPPLAWAAVVLPAWLGLALWQPAPTVAAMAAFALAALASLAAVGIHVAGARYLAIPLWYGLLFPLGYTLAALLAIHGVCGKWRGRVAWKGRIYRARREPSPGSAGSP